MDKALLFIPDISGFTRFMTGTALAHSQIIITRLFKNDYILSQPEHPVKGEAWASVEPTTAVYENFGEVRSTYINFSPLLAAAG